MAEVAAGFLAPAIEVVKWVGAPILRQFNYLCCFTTNITNLKNEAQKLQDAEQDLQGKVDAARNDVRVISSEVETWLRNSKEIKDEKNGIIDEVPNVEGGCLKLRARFSLSRRAKKTADRLKELRDQCKFNGDAISRPRPPAATEVSFGFMKELDFDRNPFCSHAIHVSIFNGLEILLTMSNCVGSLSLFTSSTAVSLVNLKELTVEDCDEMVEVIKDDEEKGMSGDRQRALQFPKLQKLVLVNLPKLVSFCEWKCDVELPSLTEVAILACHNMKSFTLGHLNTPKLKSVRIDGEEFGAVKDLNGLVQQRYLSREEEEDEEEEEEEDGGDDEDEKRE